MTREWEPNLAEGPMRIGVNLTGPEEMILSPAGENLPNPHRPFSQIQDLSALMCDAEDAMIANDNSFSFAWRRYPINDEQVQPSMRRHRLPVGLRLNGELEARYNGSYLMIEECCVGRVAPLPGGAPIAARCRWQRLMDAGVLRPSQTSAMEISQAQVIQQLADERFLRPKPPLGVSLEKTLRI